MMKNKLLITGLVILNLFLMPSQVQIAQVIPSVWDYYRVPPVWSPDGNTIVSIEANTIYLHFTDASRENLTLNGHTGEVLAAAWSHDGRFLATGGIDGVLKIWDVSTGEIDRQLEAERLTYPFVYPPVIASILWLQNDTQLAVSYLVGELSFLLILDADSLEQLRAIEFGGFYTLNSMTLHPDGQRLGGRFFALDLAPPHMITSFEHPFDQYTSILLDHITWNFAGIQLAAGSVNGYAFVWDFASGELVQQFSVNDLALIDGTSPSDLWPDIWVQSLKFSPDSETLVTIAGDGTTRHWQVATGQLLAERDLTPTDQIIAAAAWSPYAARIAYFALNRETTTPLRTASLPALQIAVPFASQAQWSALADVCLTSMQSRADLDSLLQNENYDQLETALTALSEDAIPSACRADLIAIAQALGS